jgi:hypothetical protein
MVMQGLSQSLVGRQGVPDDLILGLELHAKQHARKPGSSATDAPRTRERLVWRN